MRFYWLRDRSTCKHFNIYWKAGKHNKADYVSKHHPVEHHRNVHPHYVFDPSDPESYYSVDVNYFKPLDDSNSDTVATAPKTESDSDDDTVHHSNCSLAKSLALAGESVLIPLGRVLSHTPVPAS